MNKKFFAALALAAVVLACAALLRQRPPAESVATARAARQEPAEIRLSPNPLIPGFELVSVAPSQHHPDAVEITLRNATGRDVIAFDYVRGDGQRPEASGRSWATNIEDLVWKAGTEQTFPQPREANAPVRVSAVEFADGEVVGDEMQAAPMRETRRRTAASLREALMDVDARLGRAVASGPKLAAEARSLLAALGARETAGEDRTDPHVIVRSGNPLGSMLRQALQREVEAGGDKALPRFRARLAAAAARNEARAAKGGAK